MILRRAAEHLKQQHWTGVFIELLIVVLGVFIGMQVSNWNAARLEKQHADELFQRLVGDLESEKATVESLRDYYITTAAYAKIALRELEAPGSVDTETFVVSAYQASQWQEAITSRSTFEEIVATGAVNLIRSAKARELLIGYYEYNWTRTVTATSRPSYRELMRGVMPYAIQDAIKTTCGDQAKIIGRTNISWLPKQCHIDAPAQDIARAADALRAAPGFEQALRYQLAENDTKAGFYGGTGSLLLM